MKFTFFEKTFTPQINVSLIVIFLIIVFCFYANSKIKKYDYRTKPPKFIVVLEALIGFVNDYSKENLGKKWKSYAAYLLTLFLYLLIVNAVGMLGVTAPTTSWSITISLALITVGLTYGTRFMERGFKGFFKALAEPVPVMLPLNIISVVSTPLSMSLRLFVNLVAGSAFLMIVYSLLGYAAVIVAPWLHLTFDVFFGVIQAFVFFLLTLINIQQEIIE